MHFYGNVRKITISFGPFSRRFKTVAIYAFGSNNNCAKFCTANCCVNNFTCCPIVFLQPSIMLLLVHVELHDVDR